MCTRVRCRYTQSLEDVLNDPTFASSRGPTRDVYALSVLESTSRVHEKGYVHNDIKADNCVVALSKIGEATVLHADFDQSMVVGAPLPPSEKMKITKLYVWLNALLMRS